MLQPPHLVKYALKQCLTKLGVVYERSESARVTFHQANTYSPPAGRRNALDVVIWPDRIEVLEYSTDPRESPCTSARFGSLRAFLDAQVEKQIEWSARTWAIAKMHRANDFSGVGLDVALDESRDFAARLRAQMKSFLDTSIAVRLVSWAIRL